MVSVVACTGKLRNLIAPVGKMALAESICVLFPAGAGMLITNRLDFDTEVFHAVGFCPANKLKHFDVKCAGRDVFRRFVVRQIHVFMFSINFPRYAIRSADGSRRHPLQDEE